MFDFFIFFSVLCVKLKLCVNDNAKPYIVFLFLFLLCGAYVSVGEAAQILARTQKSGCD